MSRTFQAFCVATCAFAMFIAPASAAAPARQGVAVHYGDLDVTTQTGATALIKRLEGAARRLCSNDSHGRWQSNHAQRACQVNAVTKAVAKVNEPMVTSTFADYRNERIVLASR